MKNSTPDLFTPEDAENEDDIRATDTSILSGVVVTDVDWTTETILSQLQKGNIQLNPRFQRRDAWNEERKSRFIESLILGLPIPQLVLAENPRQKGKYVVIDGKQRLLSLLRFASVEDVQFALRGLNLRKDLNGVTFAKLQAEHRDELSAFENATIRTTIVKGWRDEEVLYLVFYRLNSGSVPLSPQELRHVLHPGPFIDFAFEFTEQSDLFVDLLGKDGKPDFRMRDVEVLIRHIAFKEFGKMYQGDLKKFLDETTKWLNESWHNAEGRVRLIAAQCEQAIVATISIFGDEAFSKWTPKGFESRFNRAVFDIMSFYFSEEIIARESTQRADLVRNAFIELCATNPDFLRAIESTTKSRASTHARFKIWGDKLSQVINVRPAGMDHLPQ